ncbi:MAG: AAA family ATPase [Epsilonproteobacteria bacterium]|nr:AAA family ATPase [Campylobacterota bacterium]
MIYFYTEDEYYYSKKGMEDLLSNEKYSSIEKILALPSEENIKNISSSDFDRTALLAPYLPGTISQKFESTQFFEIIRLPNRHGILTTGQEKLKMLPHEVLESKLGVRMELSRITMKDYGGAEELHEQVAIIKQKIKHRIPTKGFLLTGIPGTGKSFFAKALAGELGFVLVSVNLSVFEEREDTVSAINSFFDFFESTPGNYILWIDEIEKMMTGKKSQQIMGALLTKINDSKNLTSVSNFFIIATANNVKKIENTNPEFFRNGRFDLIIFLLNPSEVNAKNIFRLYIKKHEKNLIEEFLPNAIFAYAHEKEGERLPSRSSVMSQKFFGMEKEHGFSIEKVSALSYADYREEIKKSKGFAMAVMSIAKEFPFKFNYEAFVRTSMMQYRQDIQQKDRFAYTPSEIEHILNVSFNSYYLLNKNKEIDYTELCQKFRPLQTTIKDGVQDILSTSSNFIQI